MAKKKALSEQDKLNKALYEAVIDGEFSLAEEALKKGADPNIYAGLTINGQTIMMPLFFVAVKQYDPNLVVLLHEHGADIWEMDEHGMSALHHAIGSHENDVGNVRLLASLGIDVNVSLPLPEIYADKNKNMMGRAGTKPLHIASQVCEEGDSTEVIETLLGLGADVNAVNCRGLTPLHVASCLDVAKVLIEAGANLHAKDVRGWSVAHSAVVKGNPALLEYLVECGLPLDTKDYGGEAVADLAREINAEVFADILARYDQQKLNASLPQAEGATKIRKPL